MGPRLGLELSIDGACSAQRIVEWSEKGVDGFVLGTAALFGKPKKRLKATCSFRRDPVSNG